MNIFSKYGAMYADIKEHEIIRESIFLGDKLLNVGQYVHKIGEKKRSSFEMNEGVYLKYEGKGKDVDSSEVLLFSTNHIIHDEKKSTYYAFCYIDPNTLLVCNPGNHSAYDIRLETLIVYNEVKMIDLTIGEQISIFKELQI